jgi:hypothetical protein
MLDVNNGKLLQTEKTRPVVGEGAPQRQDSKFQKTTLGQKVKSGHKSH